MTLPASGNPIKLSQVDVELGLSSTAQLNMNNTSLRALFEKTSGIIKMSDGYGKSNTLPFTGFNSISTFNGSTTPNIYMYGVASNSSGRLVAVGHIFNGSTNGLPVFSTSTDGVTWTTPAVMGSVSTGFYYMYDVTCNSAGLFVAVGYMTNGLGNAPVTAVYATSSNGTTWSSPTQMGSAASTNYMMWGVTVNSSGLFVASGYDNLNSRAAYSYSSNGTNWSQPALINGVTTFSMGRRVGINASGRFVIVGRGAGGPPMTCYSDNGSTWTSPTNVGSINGTFFNVTCKASGRWVAVGSTNLNGSNGIAIAAYSDDGISWTSSYMNTSSSYGDMWGVTVDKNGKFVAVGNSQYPTNQAVYSTSTDGVTWSTLTAVPPGGTNSYYLWDSCVQPTTGKMCAVGTYGPGPYGIQTISY